MKSTEVYSLLKSELVPWFKLEGFKRTKGFLGWSRSHGGADTVIWFQVSQDGWDSFAGSGFIVEFQRSQDSVIGSSKAIRQRLSRFLSNEEREEVRSIQNSVIAELHTPPRSYPLLHVSPDVAHLYLMKFNILNEPYPESKDIWLRYASPEHVRRWAHFIQGILPRCVAVAESWPIAKSGSTLPSSPKTAP